MENEATSYKLQENERLGLIKRVLNAVRSRIPDTADEKVLGRRQELFSVHFEITKKLNELRISQEEKDQVRSLLDGTEMQGRILMDELYPNPAIPRDETKITLGDRGAWVLLDIYFDKLTRVKSKHDEHLWHQYVDIGTRMHSILKQHQVPGANIALLFDALDKI